MSTRAHHVQLIARSLSAGQVGSSTQLYLFLNTGNTGPVTFYMGQTAALLVNKLLCVIFRDVLKQELVHLWVFRLYIHSVYCLHLAIILVTFDAARLCSAFNINFHCKSYWKAVLCFVFQLNLPVAPRAKLVKASPLCVV